MRNDVAGGHPAAVHEPAKGDLSDLAGGLWRGMQNFAAPFMPQALLNQLDQSAAAKVAVDLQKSPLREKLDVLYNIGSHTAGFDQMRPEIVAAHPECEGYPPRTVIFGDFERKWFAKTIGETPAIRALCAVEDGSVCSNYALTYLCGVPPRQFVSPHTFGFVDAMRDMGYELNVGPQPFNVVAYCKHSIDGRLLPVHFGMVASDGQIISKNSFNWVAYKHDLSAVPNEDYDVAVFFKASNPKLQDPSAHPAYLPDDNGLFTFKRTGEAVEISYDGPRVSPGGE